MSAMKTASSMKITSSNSKFWTDLIDWLNRYPYNPEHGQIVLTVLDEKQYTGCADISTAPIELTAEQAAILELGT